MSVPRNILKELLERKLWPIALVLIVALVAVPVLLTKKAPTDIVTPPTGPLPYSSGTTLPAISVQTSPGELQARRQGPQPVHAAARRHDDDHHDGRGRRDHDRVRARARPRDGHGRRHQLEQRAAAAAPRRRRRPRRRLDHADPDHARADAPAKPAPTGLTSTQSYHVSLAITTADGGLNTIDPLERLSILPSKQQPMLVELGVLQGGHSVLFVVEPGTVVSGAGHLHPGSDRLRDPVAEPRPDRGHLEADAHRLDSGRPVLGELDQRRSAPVGRRGEQGSPRPRPSVGRELLNKSPLSAISLFQYDPSVGAVVDLRNLTVGGN